MQPGDRMSAHAHRLGAAAALAALSLIWGYNFVVMKRAMSYVGAFDFSAMRT